MSYTDCYPTGRFTSPHVFETTVPLQETVFYGETSEVTWAVLYYYLLDGVWLIVFDDFSELEAFKKERES